MRTKKKTVEQKKTETARNPARLYKCCVSPLVLFCCVNCDKYAVGYCCRPNSLLHVVLTIS